MTSGKLSQFKKEVLAYYKKFGRHDLPWRKTRDPYQILVSEIMLQQTQVERGIAYFKKFIKRFPTARHLARAKPSSVLKAWQGLGYNRRALYLKRAAEATVKLHAGKVPDTEEKLLTLPGIGPYTAAAVRAFAFNKPALVLDTNIRRVYIHFFFPRKKAVHDRELIPLIERTVDKKNPRKWFSALMDYGAMLGTLKKKKNPNRRSAHYARQSRFEGSDRQIRGKILRHLLEEGSVSLGEVRHMLSESEERVARIALAMAKEDMITLRKNVLSLH